MLCVDVCCASICYSECGVLCILLMFVSNVSGGHIVETYSGMGIVMGLYVTSIVSFCFLHVVDVSDLSICIVLRAFVVVFSICEFGVESQS